MANLVVLGLDASQDSVRAIPYAAEQAGFDGKVIVVHVPELILGPAGGLRLIANEDEVEADVRRQVEDLNSVGVRAELVVISAVAGGPAHVIADVARQVNADVIVVGTRGHRYVSGATCSVTHKLLQMSICPVPAVLPAVSGPGYENTEEAIAGNA